MVAKKKKQSPYYYYKKNNEFMVASEIKSFLDHPCFEKELNERKKVLTNRANTFIKECEKVNLKTCDFQFYIWKR